MEAVRKINNNVVICRDSKGRELVAMGKGLGFGTIPRTISLKEIERTFYNIEDKYYKLVEEIPSEILSFAAEIVDIAQNELPYHLNPNQSVALADHISFTIERARKNIRVRMPLSYDIQQLYPREYRIGQYAVRRIRKEFKIGLPGDEVIGIAMNLINGKVSESSSVAASKKKEDEEMLEDITVLIEKKLCFIVDRESYSYARYATHLQYLFGRIHSGKVFKTDNAGIYETLKKEFPDIYQCAEAIRELIKLEWNNEITDEETLYLMLHINRIYTKHQQLEEV